MYYGCFVFLLFIVYQASACTQWHAVYNNLGCKPVFANPNEQCPIEYDCSKLRKTSDSQCFMNGKFFNSLDKIPDDVTKNPCMIGCRCSHSARPSVQCAVVDCPSEGRMFQEGCFKSYESNCCPQKLICRSDKSLSTCLYHNVTYVEGEPFYPDLCTECSCKKGFAGKLEEPFCGKTGCVAKEDYYNAVVNNCAPIYSKKHCCPVGFSCAKGSEISVTITKSATEHTCRFGDKVLNIGDTAEIEVPVKARCECSIPPLVSCVSGVSYQVLMDTFYG